MSLIILTAGQIFGRFNTSLPKTEFPGPVCRKLPANWNAVMKPSCPDGPISGHGIDINSNQILVRRPFPRLKLCIRRAVLCLCSSGVGLLGTVQTPAISHGIFPSRGLVGWLNNRPKAHMCNAA